MDLGYKKIVLSLLIIILFVINLGAQNPFLPPWEYIPDGEPRVFGDRVYIYGSHDKAGSTTFCDTKYVVWSAPLNNLTDWYKEGESFYSKADENGIDDVSWSDNDLYAPDLVEKGGKYYLYVYIVGAPGCVAVSDVPGGPFKYLSKYAAPAGSPPDFGGWGQYIDPGVLVDDDGKVYIYWGYKRSYMAQINPDNLYEILPGTYKEDIIPTDAPFKFFEGASIRKINGTYYLIYAQGSSLAYATSDSPDGPFEYGGVIVQNGIDYPGGNIHGSLCEINGQWYIFYHRMTNNTIMSRKACAERVTIEADGSIKEVEMTSLGFSQSLNPYQEYSPYIACVLKGGNYITEIDSFTHPVIKNKSNSLIGFKYFDFTTTDDSLYTRFTASVKGGTANGEMEIWIDSPEPDKGAKIGFIDIIHNAGFEKDWQQISAHVKNTSGLHALYFKFISENSSDIICDLKSFRFERTNQIDSTPPNERPFVKNNIPPFVGYINNADTIGFVNLTNVFFDREDSANLAYSVAANTNSALVTPSIGSESELNLSFKNDKAGNGMVTIKAIDSGSKWMTTNFSVHILDPGAENKALYQLVSASSLERDNYYEIFINDGNLSTRWSSKYSDNQEVIFTLDSAYLIKKIMLNWEGAYGKDYNILFSSDGIVWEQVATVENSNGGIDKVIIPGNKQAKFVKLELVKRATQWGFSLWEVEFYQDDANLAPVGIATLTNQAAKVNTLFSYALPAKLFTDDGDELVYSASLKDGANLPGWLVFNPGTLTFSGTPAIADTGAFIVSVKATDTFGATGELFFNITVSGITGVKDKTNDGISIYPNPVKDALFLQSDNRCIKGIAIFDITGKELYSVSFPVMVSSYNIPVQLNNGCYYVRMSGDSQSVTKPFIVNKY